MHYRNSAAAWQNTMLFKEWFFDIFVPQVTKHLNEMGLEARDVLLLDNASCHGNESLIESPDGNFKTLFFHQTQHLYCNRLIKT